ncbi:MAG: glycosyltransferase family 2 protein [Rhodobacteraceae bacterium]|nr:glycosyltransferase family 2 protein [Paracoccaceae bacterium]
MSKSSKSWLKKIRRGAGSFINQTPSFPLVCAAMVRDEIDIIDIWVSHLISIFDHVIIYDHLSKDGTRERLNDLAKHNKNIEIRDYSEPAFEQSTLMTTAFKDVASHTPVGWMFFLDADEFILHKSRAELIQELSQHDTATVVEMKWMNAYPTSVDSHIQATTEIEGWLDGPCRIDKIAVNLSQSDNVLTITKGNHRIRPKRLVDFRKVTLENTHLLHIPIRTTSQINSKISTGIASIALIEHGDLFGAHWRAMAHINDFTDMKTHVYNYGNLKGLSDELIMAPPSLVSISGRLSNLITVGKSI